MAPREPRGAEKTRRRKGHRQHKVRFHHQSGKALPPGPATRKSAQDVRPPENYESLILYYLTKLKRLFSSGGGHEKPPVAAEEVRPQPTTGGEENIKDKVFNVVSAALEYGLANNVLEKRGDFFTLRTRGGQRIAARAPTPGPPPRRVPSRYCSRCNCASCVVVKPPGGAACGGGGGAAAPHQLRRQAAQGCRCPRCAGGQQQHHHHPQV